MKHLLKIIVITLALTGMSTRVNATHVAGTDINYSCVGQDSFLITLNIFRDCNGASLGNTAIVQFTSSCGSNLSSNLTLQNGSLGTEVSQLCPSVLVNSTCNGGSLPGVQQYVYQGIVVLSPICNLWTMSWVSCCRNTSVNVVGQAYVYIKATMNSAVNSCNNSPVFSANSIPYVCLNQVVSYNFGVTEPDGDSLVYAFVDPLIGTGGPVPFQSGYTYSQPIPGITLDTITGQLTFTPATLGAFVLAIKVCEYEYGTGILKGCVTRDFEFMVINCSNQVPTAPVTGISNFTGTGLLLGPDSVEVCVGNFINFDIVFSDADTADTVTLFSNITTVLPGATISSMPGNPATITVNWIAQPGTPPVNSFTVTGVDNACPIQGATTASYNVIVVPATNAGPDLTICQGTQWAQLGAIGGNLFTWSVLSGSPMDTVPSSPGYNMTCNSCQYPQVSPAITTTYVVTSNLVGACVNIDTITVNVVSNFNLLMPNDTFICSIDDFPLQIICSQSTFSYTYDWSPSSSLNYDTVQIPIANPSDPTTYSVTVEASNGCVKSGSVFIDLSPPFPANMSITGDTVLCAGQVTQLGIDFGNVPITDCGITTQECLGVNQDGDVGANTTVNIGNGYPAIYAGSQEVAKHQIIYTASELQNLGMSVGGMLNSIAFYVNTVGMPSTFDNFEIKMGCTSESDLTNGWMLPNNMTVIVPSYTHTAIAGWNVHNFVSSYKWDGQSSLVFEICFNNSVSFAMGNSIMRHSQTGFQSVLFQAGNNISICQNYSQVGAGYAVLSDLRPNTRFNFCTGVDPLAMNYSWSPAIGLTNTTILNPFAGPSSSTTYQVIVSDTFGGCVDTVDMFVDVVNQFNSGFSFNDPYCVSDSADLAQVNVGGGYFTGNAIDSNGWFYPGSAGAGYWPITYHLTTPALCASDTTIYVSVIGLPDASVGYQEVCYTSGPITLVPATPGGVYGGLGITDTIAGIFDPMALFPGIYPVSYTLTQPCWSTDTVGIKIIESYGFIFILNEITVCQDDTVHLGNNYILSNSPLQGAGPILSTWSDNDGYIDTNGVFDASSLAPGDYYVRLSVTGSNGLCGTQKTMVVKVLGIDHPYFEESIVFCESDGRVDVELWPWLFGNGTSFTQVPIAPLTSTDTLLITQFGQDGRFYTTTQGVGSWEITVSHTNLNGCTGVIIDTIYVLPTPTNNSVSQGGGVITANLSGGYDYQWLDCGNNMTPVVGANSQSFRPAVTGDYAVEISAGNCSITSSCYLGWPLSVSDVDTYGVEVYPNPTDDVINIDKGQNQTLEIEITDNTGKLVLKTNAVAKVTSIDVSAFSSGIYFVKVSSEVGEVTHKIVKR